MMAAASDGANLFSGGGPGATLAPRSVAELVEQLSATSPADTFRIVGAGTWPGVIDHLRASCTLDLSGLRGITEYVPGDLTLTALAGTPLREIAEATQPHGQWLPLDPWGSDAGTLGATLATASAGPMAASIGLPRDAALGTETVDATGTRVHAGGRVVKNVAGFDLVRLHVGAWGTLGVLTEATVRLRPLPPTDRTLAIAIRGSGDSLGELVAEIRALPLPPLAAELIGPGLARFLGLNARAVLLVRLGGSARAVEGAVDHLNAKSATAETPVRIWDTLRGAEPPDAAVVRYSLPPSRIAPLWAAILGASDEAAVHATPARGIVRVMASGPVHKRVEQATSHLRPTVVVERGLGNLARLAAPGTERIARELRDAFDPDRRLNPGLFDDARG
jgi:glycolate oxidase FAD binding subunit